MLVWNNKQVINGQADINTDLAVGLLIEAPLLVAPGIWRFSPAFDSI